MGVKHSRSTMDRSPYPWTTEVQSRKKEEFLFLVSPSLSPPPHHRHYPLAASSLSLVHPSPPSHHRCLLPVTVTSSHHRCPSIQPSPPESLSPLLPWFTTSPLSLPPLPRLATFPLPFTITGGKHLVGAGWHWWMVSDTSRAIKRSKAWFGWEKKSVSHSFVQSNWQ